VLHCIGGSSESIELEPKYNMLKTNRLWKFCVCLVFLALCEFCPVYGSNWKQLPGHVHKIISHLVPRGLFYFTLTNSGGAGLSWKKSGIPAWLNLSAANDTLASNNNGLRNSTVDFTFLRFSHGGV
jgi:hypothetical protein